MGGTMLANRTAVALLLLGVVLAATSEISDLGSEGAVAPGRGHVDVAAVAVAEVAKPASEIAMLQEDAQRRGMRGGLRKLRRKAVKKAKRAVKSRRGKKANKKAKRLLRKAKKKKSRKQEEEGQEEAEEV